MKQETFIKLVASKGAGVFPLPKGGKIPFGIGKEPWRNDPVLWDDSVHGGGIHRAIYGADKVAALLLDHPITDYNYAIVPGPSILIFDLDLKKEDESGIDIFDEKMADIDPRWRENTLVVKTPSGGFHVYYIANCAFKSSDGWLPSVDLRSIGKYVVAPGSIDTTTGKLYEIINPDVQIAKLPESLSKLLPVYKKTGPRDRQVALQDFQYVGMDEDFIDDTNSIKIAQQYLKEERNAPTTAGHGTALKTIKRIIGYLGDLGVSPLTCHNMLTEEPFHADGSSWADASSPAWESREIDSLIRFIYGPGREQPVGCKTAHGMFGEKALKSACAPAPAPAPVATTKTDKDATDAPSAIHPHTDNIENNLVGDRKDIFKREREARLIENILLKNGITLLIGKKGCGKTHTGVALGFNVCFSAWDGGWSDFDGNRVERPGGLGDIAGNKIMTDKRVRLLYVMSEHQVQAIQAIDGWTSNMGAMPNADNVFMTANISKWTPPLHFQSMNYEQSDAMFRDLRKKIAQHDDEIILTVLDVMPKLIGNADRNDAGDMASFYQKLERGSAIMGGPIIGICHPPRGIELRPNGSAENENSAVGILALKRENDNRVVLTVKEIKTVEGGTQVSFISKKVETLGHPGDIALVYEHDIDAKPDCNAVVELINAVVNLSGDTPDDKAIFPLNKFVADAVKIYNDSVIDDDSNIVKYMENFDPLYGKDVQPTRRSKLKKATVMRRIRGMIIEGRPFALSTDITVRFKKQRDPAGGNQSPFSIVIEKPVSPNIGIGWLNESMFEDMPEHTEGD